jgi:hypothetical protein
MPKLLIKRSSGWANKSRTIHLFLNEKKFAALKDGQLLSFEIPEGRYQIKAKIDWCGSQPLDLDLTKGEITRLEIKGFIFSEYLLPVALITGFLYFMFYFRYHINSLWLAALLMFFLGYLLYFFSFGRDQFLRIKII